MLSREVLTAFSSLSESQQPESPESQLETLTDRWHSSVAVTRAVTMTMANRVPMFAVYVEANELLATTKS